MHLLLWAEELQWRVDIMSYDMAGSKLRQRRMGGRGMRGGEKLFQLDIPGLAENRPNVVRGDAVRIFPEEPQSSSRGGATSSSVLGSPAAAPAASSQQWVGFVHFRNFEDVFISLPQGFSCHRSVTVRFDFDRAPLRRMHRALDSLAAMSAAEGFAAAAVIESAALEAGINGGATQSSVPSASDEGPLAGKDKGWEGLSEREKAAAVVLGYDELTWDAGAVVPLCMLPWSDLPRGASDAATLLGYSVITWDAELADLESGRPCAPVESVRPGED